MTGPLTTLEAAELLARDGHYLDTRQWDAWLDLFTDDVVYWVPAWKNEAEATQDPERELSLIYDADRTALVDRVWRIRSGLSVASTPLWRTAHQVGNVVLPEPPLERSAEVRASWTCHAYNPANGKQHAFFGLYEMTLRRDDPGVWKIARKKTLLLNDRIPTVLDVYMI